MSLFNDKYQSPTLVHVVQRVNGPANSSGINPPKYVASPCPNRWNIPPSLEYSTGLLAVLVEVVLLLHHLHSRSPMDTQVGLDYTYTQIYSCASAITDIKYFVSIYLHSSMFNNLFVIDVFMLINKYFF